MQRSSYCISKLHSGYASTPEKHADFLKQQRAKIQKHYPPHATFVPVQTAEGFASFAIVGVTADQANAIDAAVKEAAWLRNWQEKLESPDKDTAAIAQTMLQQEMKRQGIKNTAPVVEDTTPQPSLLQKTWGVVKAVGSLGLGFCVMGAMQLSMRIFPSAWSDLNDKVSEAFDRAEAAQAIREPTPPAPQTVENIIVDPKDLQARAEAIVAQMTIVPPETNIPAVEAEAETPHSPAMQEALRQAMNPDAGKSSDMAPTAIRVSMHPVGVKPITKSPTAIRA